MTAGLRQRPDRPLTLTLSPAYRGEGISHTTRKTLAKARFLPFLLLCLLLNFPTLTSAKPSQSDVFKSIQENVNQSDGSMGKAVPWLCAGAGVILVLAIFGKRQSRQLAPKPLNHVGRLLREIMRSVPLKPKELKQLKVVADETRLDNNQTVSNPLVLLLCPSVLNQALEKRSTRADRRTLLHVLKKLEV